MFLFRYHGLWCPVCCCEWFCLSVCLHLLIAQNSYIAFWLIYTDSGTCSCQCCLSNFTAISLHIVKCSWAHTGMYVCIIIIIIIIIIFIWNRRMSGLLPRFEPYSPSHESNALFSAGPLYLRAREHLHNCLKRPVGDVVLVGCCDMPQFGQVLESGWPLTQCARVAVSFTPHVVSFLGVVTVQSRGQQGWYVLNSTQFDMILSPLHPLLHNKSLLSSIKMGSLLHLFFGLLSGHIPTQTLYAFLVSPSQPHCRDSNCFLVV